MSSQPITPYKNSVAGKKEQVRTMFDNIAGTYDFLNHFLSLGIDIRWRNKVVKYLQPYSPKKILDVATGTGDFAVSLLSLNPSSVTGIDISPGMLAVGKEKIKKLHEEKRIHFLEADSEKLPFEDNTFDAITVGFGVRNFENLEAGLSEMYRVLKPGGVATVLEFSKPSIFPVRQLYTFYFCTLLPFLGRLISKDKAAYTYLPASVQAFPDGKYFLSLYAGCGFKDVTQIPLTFGIASIYTGKK